MKFLTQICVGGLFAVISMTAVTADATIYLMRHAEKQIDGTQDPSLTGPGHIRAAALAARLQTVKLEQIYSTNFKRTLETAAPTATAHKLAVTPYSPNALADLAATLKETPKTTLVVGHSNTTPVVVNFLAGTNYPLLEDHQYDHLYIVTLKENGEVSVKIDYIKPRTP